MRAVIQRVTQASVTVDGQVVSSIGRGEPFLPHHWQRLPDAAEYGTMPEEPPPEAASSAKQRQAPTLGCANPVGADDLAFSQESFA